MSFPASAVSFYATAFIAAATLAGCTVGRLSADAPAGVHLAGDWKLDLAHSDDLGKAVAQLRAQSAKARRQMARGQAQSTAAAPPGGQRHRHRGGDAGGQQASQADENGSASGTGATGDDMSVGTPRSSSVDELMSNVPRGDYLRITVSANSFRVTSGDSSDQYTPGLQSDISAEQGDAQQISGWKGQEYVIDTTPQFGAEITQRYGLTKDGRLTLTLRLKGRGTNLTFTRVYERTTSVAPLAPPTIN